jgi:hypothetical protein
LFAYSGSVFFRRRSDVTLGDLLRRAVGLAFRVSPSHPRECLHCKELFLPDAHNPGRQKFCGKTACRKASQAESQRRWLSQPGNTRYFRDEKNVERVQEWRQAHPDYWKRSPKPAVALQEVCPSQVVENKDLPLEISCLPLQEVVPVQDLPLQDLVPPLPTQDPLLVGLIAHLIDCPLQENVAQATRGLILKGRGILGLSSGMPPKTHYESPKENSVSATAAPHSRTVQLDRSTAGA